ncbi:MAG: hypothetical protein ACP5HW_00450 [Candidatus Micrarchaeia archaeon]
MSLDIIPYDKIKYAKIKVKKEELIDMPHAARLQYRLLTNEAIIKAKVHFNEGLIELYYNPKGKENKSLQPKTSMEEILKILADNNVHAKTEDVKEEVVDYKEKLFEPTFHPKEIRKVKPYGW